MLKFNTNSKTLENLQVSEMRNENILERYDFQSSIVNSWDVVRNKLGLPTSYLIGQEINPHESVGNAIDLLAFNPDDSTLIVIELKRDRNKLQLLQALSYAAMVATWDKDQLIAKIRRSINPDASELTDFINNNDLNSNVKIILVSESYDPEVIITAEWLRRNYGMDIVAFGVNVLKEGPELFLNLEQRLPLKELADAYERRGQRSRVVPSTLRITWDDQIPKLKYPFGVRAVRIFSDIKEGEPNRKRINGVHKQLDGFSGVDIQFPEKYLRVYVGGTPENAEEIIQSKFSTPVLITPANGYFGFNVETESQFDELLKWLGIHET